MESGPRVVRGMGRALVILMVMCVAFLSALGVLWKRSTAAGQVASTSWLIVFGGLSVMIGMYLLVGSRQIAEALNAFRREWGLDARGTEPATLVVVGIGWVSVGVLLGLVGFFSAP